MARGRLDLLPSVVSSPEGLKLVPNDAKLVWVKTSLQKGGLIPCLRLDPFIRESKPLS